ncbi:hypothetical protein NX059_003902 [Plenodomus lindquistii]|nr:hypothetical protein NX059_003902 [Plenodomus lindquistii]
MPHISPSEFTKNFAHTREFGIDSRDFLTFTTILGDNNTRNFELDLSVAFYYTVSVFSPAPTTVTMAPQRTVSGDPPTAIAVAGSRVVKSRRKKAVRRFENGLMNFERKNEKNAKMSVSITTGSSTLNASQRKQLTCHSTEQNAQQSPLLRLPGELRNQIWELALGGNVCEIKKYYDVPEHCRENFPTALLQTCRQVFAETALLPYSLNNSASTSPSQIGLTSFLCTLSTVSSVSA